MNPIHHKHAECAPHTLDGLFTVFAKGDELGYQRIVVGRNHAICIGRRIDADANAARQLARNSSWRRREGLRMFGINPAFHGMAVNLHRPLDDVAELFARRDADLRFH